VVIHWPALATVAAFQEQPHSRADSFLESLACAAAA
jgi:hypothetical protein